MCTAQCCLALLDKDQTLPPHSAMIEVSYQQALQERMDFECTAMPINEVYEALCKLPEVEFSYAPFEALLWREFAQRLTRIKTAEDVDMFAAPLEVVAFLKTHGIVTDNVLKQWARWSLEASYRPNTLSHKRPTARELTYLYGLIAERSEDPAY